MNKEPYLLLNPRRSKSYGYPESGLAGTVADAEPPGYGRGYIGNKVIGVISMVWTFSIDASRPFSKRMENNVLRQYLNIWNYNSDAIEGNHLTYGEPMALLQYGISAKGKP